MAWEPVVGQRRQDGHLPCCAREHLDHVGRLAPILRPFPVAEGRKMAGRQGESSVVVLMPQLITPFLLPLLNTEVRNARRVLYYAASAAAAGPGWAIPTRFGTEFAPVRSTYYL
jgi:hypothetical protein